MLRLRNIELSGFKSFADRTSIPLPEEILVIVGPNGSGKSNVTDAILWALGEQSAKTLRGRKMLDVIFGGSRKRQPAGSTEVILTFEFSDGKKVRIGRRLIRTGDSAYLMDGRSVRLKDVHDFLLRNGISKQGSFLVEQGRVEALLSASPEERRIIFEEVAGIAHYKENRKSALQKLEAAQGNLLRLNDVISEVDQQRRALKRQANAADRYVKLTDELRDRKRAFWGRACAELSTQKDDLEKECSMHRSELEKRRVLFNQRQAELEEAKEKEYSHEASLQALIKELHENELLRERIEQENKRRTDKILASRERVRQIGVDRKELDSRVASARENHGEVSARVRALEEKEKIASDKAEQAGVNLDRCREAAESTEEKLKRLRAEAFEHAQSKSTRATELQRIKDEIARQESRKTRLAREEEELSTRMDAVAEELENCGGELDQARGNFEKASENRQSLEELVSKKRQELAGSQEKLKTATTDLAVAEKGLKVLLENESSLRSSAHAFLAEKAEDRVGKTMAAYLADVPEKLVAPLSSVLGELLEGYAEQDWKGLPELITLLDREKAGQAVFFLKDHGQAQVEQPEESRGFISWLCDVEGLPPDLKKVLPTVGLVETSDDALAFVCSNGIAAVTEDGIYVSPDGWVRGGSGGSGGPSLLEFERNRKSYESEIASLRKSVAENGKDFDKATASLEDVSKKLELARELEINTREALSSRQKKYDDVAQEESRLKASRELLEDEKLQIKEETTAFEEQYKELEVLLTEAEDKRKEIEKLTAETEKLLNKTRQNIEAAHEEVAVSRASLGGTAQALEGAREAAATSSSRLEELLDTGKRLDNEKISLEKRITDLTAEVTRGDQELRDILLKIDDQRENRARFEETLESLRRDVKACEERLKEAQATVDQIKDELSELEKELATVSAELKAFSERIAENLEDSVGELAARFAGEEPLSEEEKETIQAAMARLENRIERIGNVNLLARDEYNELNTRWEFLDSQKNDLMESVASLKETINKINKTSRNRFMEAFNAVSEHFSHLFREVFEGGEAKISLLDENNPLETGVEVYAQPPGKKLQSLQLLSGGEKAMVALALLFGLFMYRPQPFFILDEVDAPLDEANITRFSRLLRRFQGETQFLVVSHNKRTMEIAQILYGVTMSESGVSRIVSVRLAEVEKEIS